MDCDIEIHDDLGTFAASVREFLEQREAENGLMLGLLGARPGDSSGDGPIMVRAAADGQTVFVAFRRGPHLVVTRGPDVALVATAARLGALGLEVPGVIGPAREAESFAQIWAEQMGCTARLVVKQRLYQLTQVTWPQGVPGNMRALGTADSDLAARWGQAFDAECLPAYERRSLDQARDKSASRIADGNLFAWQVDGEPVAMAGLTRPTARTIAINSVYTPPERRRRGFATALVAALSEEGLHRGKQACILYTDLANPTSNSIYQKIGYRPVFDSRNYRFEPRGS